MVFYEELSEISVLFGLTFNFDACLGPL